MDGVELLGHAQVAAFLVVAGAALWQWFRQRSRPAAYLALAFVVLAPALLAARIIGRGSGAESTLLTVGVMGAVAAFPWLLALFAWSFEGPAPRWLLWAGVAVAGLTAWSAVVSPLVGRDEPRTLQQTLFVVVYLALWSALAVASAVRLWRAGNGQRLVRARTRLMAVGALLAAGALFAAVASGSLRPAWLDGVLRVFGLASALLFVAGFAPPLPLRVWWRRRSSRRFQDAQGALIGAATPEGVAGSIAPLLADLVGGGVAVIGPDGRLLACAQLGRDEAEELAAQVVSGRSLPQEIKVLAVGDSWLAVRATPYTPVFGQDEYELLEMFSLHLRLALERSQLFRSEQRAREEAQSARHELESMLYGLSHDLKSPSLAISGFVDLLPDAVDEAERQEMYRHIKASTAYLNELVEALLELSRVGRTQTRAEPVDLEHTARDVARRVEVNHPGATVRTEGPLPVVSLNPVRAQQLLDNLVGNAVRHAGRDDVTVTIGGQMRDGHLELSVQDDGSGVPEDERERIFELFRRGSTSRGAGSGVGLGLVRRIAEVSGGTLELADSEVGARFVVRLPEHLVVDGEVPRA